MTSQSRKNLLITAPSSGLIATINNVRSFARLIQLVDLPLLSSKSTLLRPLALSLALAPFSPLASNAIAQNGWSPEPFVPKPSIRSLKEAAVPQLGSTPNKTLHQNQQQPGFRSASSTSSSMNSGVVTASTTTAMGGTPSNTLRNESDGAVVLRWKRVHSQNNSKPAVQLTSHEAFHGDNAVQLAQFQAPPLANPNADTNVQPEQPAIDPNKLPFRDPLTPKNSKQSLLPPETDSVPVDPKEFLDVPPKSLNFQRPSTSDDGSFNLTEPPTTESPKIRENPFLDQQNRKTLPPNGGTPKKNSPSDLEDSFDQTARGNDLDGDMPPRSSGVNRLDQSCDDVRSRALSADIEKVQLDISPEFGTGPKDMISPEDRRSNFSRSSPYRTWYDFSGQVLATGRIVDLKNDELIIEAKDGTLYNLAVRELSDPDAAYLFDAWGLPVTCSLGQQPFKQRNYVPTTVAWKASGLCHKPLYFEDVQLERYGHEFGPIIQPVLSTAHFFTNVAFLPYNMGVHPMKECQYSLGYYRPGSCAPWTIDPIPLSLRGALQQGAAIGGAAAILP